jgi:hypothetical protein
MSSYPACSPGTTFSNLYESTRSFLMTEPWASCLRCLISQWGHWGTEIWGNLPKPPTQ